MQGLDTTNGRRAFALGALTVLASACVGFPGAPPVSTTPRIFGDTLIVSDGAPLGLSVWAAPDPKAVILAVHGMNDYALTFEDAAKWWSERASIAVYAYDQRGFGRSPEFGRWPGSDSLKSDLRAAIGVIRARHPGVPFFVAGHSMGAAVVLAAAEDAPLDVDGAILAAPGVWGGAQLPIAYRIAANLSAALTPGATVTGERAQRQSTDNIALLRRMQADPHVIKATRLDSVLGVVRLMGEGWSASNAVGGRVLLLYGEKDEIIPVRAMRATGQRLCGDVTVRAYGEGWHMLFGDLHAEVVWRDVAGWIVQEEEKMDAAARVSGLRSCGVQGAGAG
jgi:acylglycerol lipase